ncbi:MULTISPECIES: hypothetical protein [unclassified Microcoleus]|uniref:hypothetical protein n=1 Tax=unclassified Microcoleus TaxID=2642155 RepID=UPI002FD4780C
MTMITSSFKEVEQEEEANVLTTLQTSPKNSSSTPVRRIPYVPSLAQRSAESGNAEVRKYYPLSPRTQINMGSIISKPVGHQANFIKSDPKERRGRFLSSPSSDWSKNLPRTPKKVEAIHPQQQNVNKFLVSPADREEDVLDWDFYLENPPLKPAATIELEFEYRGRSQPIPVTDPWDE